MRYLAIDPGTRRIGLACGDRDTRVVTPLRPIELTPGQDAADAIAVEVEQQAPDALLVGLPLNMDGSEGPAARSARELAVRLARVAGVKVCLVDERLTSFAAEQQLRDRAISGEHLTRRDKRDRVDSLSAAVLLEDVLAGRIQPIPVDPDSGSNPPP
jgi:putative Holliday junction resolvase